MRSLSLVIFCLAPTFAQSLHFGLQAGVPVTEYFDASPGYSSATRRYTVGAFAEWQATGTLALDAGVLYHRIGYSGIPAVASIRISSIPPLTSAATPGISP